MSQALHLLTLSSSSSFAANHSFTCAAFLYFVCAIHLLDFFDFCFRFLTRTILYMVAVAMDVFAAWLALLIVVVVVNIVSVVAFLCALDRLFHFFSAMK